MLRMALAHDLPEARTGDLNYVNQKYVAADEERAADDMTRGLPFGDELRELMAEYREEISPEAVLAHDADQLEMLLELKEKLDSGCQAAEDWTPFVLRRLRTDVAKRSGRKNPRWRFRIVVVRPRLGMVGPRWQGLSSI